MRLALCVGLALAILFSGEGPVLGQERTDPAVIDGPMRPNKQEAARRHKLGLKFFSMAKHLAALREFRIANKLEPQPDRLVNIATCQEQLDRPREAIETLQDHRARYPEDPGREKVERKIAELKRKLMLDYAETEEPASEGSTLQERPRWPRTLGWLALAAGGASLLMGAVFSGLASNKAAEYDDSKSTATYTALQEIERDGERLEDVQIGTLVVGSVLAVTGTVLVLIFRDSPPVGGPSTGAMVVPFASGDAVGFSALTRF